jgi:hypothetical protein
MNLDKPSRFALKIAGTNKWLAQVNLLSMRLGGRK